MSTAFTVESVLGYIQTNGFSSQLVLDCLRATMQANTQRINVATRLLSSEFRAQPSYLTHLLSIVGSRDQIEPSVRLAATIQAKQYVYACWVMLIRSPNNMNYEGSTIGLSVQDRASFHQGCIPLVMQETDPRIKDQLIMMIRHVMGSDYPNYWTNLIETLGQCTAAAQNDQQKQIVFEVICRFIQGLSNLTPLAFREALSTVINGALIAIEPHVQEALNALTPVNVVYVKLALEMISSSLTLYIPNVLMDNNVVSKWMNYTLNFMILAPSKEIEELYPTTTDVSSLPFFQAKFMGLNVLRRYLSWHDVDTYIFNGAKKTVKTMHKTFANNFFNAYSGHIMNVCFGLLAAELPGSSTNGGQLNVGKGRPSNPTPGSSQNFVASFTATDKQPFAPIHILTADMKASILNTLKFALRRGQLFKNFIVKNIENLLVNTIIPLLMLSEDAYYNWENDPSQYNGNLEEEAPIDDFDSPGFIATSLINDMVYYRPKQVFNIIATVASTILQEYKYTYAAVLQGQASMEQLIQSAMRKEVALRIVGQVAGPINILYQGSAEQILMNDVFMDLQLPPSADAPNNNFIELPVPLLRARGLLYIRDFAGTAFSAETYRTAISAVCAHLGHKDLTVRVHASLTISAIVKCAKEEDEDDDDFGESSKQGVDSSKLSTEVKQMIRSSISENISSIIVSLVSSMAETSGDHIGLAIEEIIDTLPQHIPPMALPLLQVVYNQWNKNFTNSLTFNYEDESKEDEIEATLSQTIQLAKIIVATVITLEDYVELLHAAEVLLFPFIQIILEKQSSDYIEHAIDLLHVFTYSPTKISDISWYWFPRVSEAILSWSSECLEKWVEPLFNYISRDFNDFYNRGGVDVIMSFATQYFADPSDVSTTMANYSAKLLTYIAGHSKDHQGMLESGALASILDIAVKRMVTCLSGGLLNLKVLLIDTIAACFYAHTAGTVKALEMSGSLETVFNHWMSCIQYTKHHFDRIKYSIIGLSYLTAYVMQNGGTLQNCVPVMVEKLFELDSYAKIKEEEEEDEDEDEDDDDDVLFDIDEDEDIDTSIDLNKYKKIKKSNVDIFGKPVKISAKDGDSLGGKSKNKNSLLNTSAAAHVAAENMAQEREEKGNSGKKKSNSKKQAKIENDDDDEPEALDLNTHIDQQTNYFEKMLKTKAGAAAAALDADDGSIRKLGSSYMGLNFTPVERINHHDLFLQTIFPFISQFSSNNLTSEQRALIEYCQVGRKEFEEKSQEYLKEEKEDDAERDKKLRETGPMCLSLGFRPVPTPTGITITQFKEPQNQQFFMESIQEQMQYIVQLLAQQRGGQ